MATSLHLAAGKGNVWVVRWYLVTVRSVGSDRSTAGCCDMELIPTQERSTDTRHCDLEEASNFLMLILLAVTGQQVRGSAKSFGDSCEQVCHGVALTC
eukprot:762822-Hanusia_phi.AAC.7